VRVRMKAGYIGRSPAAYDDVRVRMKAGYIGRSPAAYDAKTEN